MRVQGSGLRALGFDSGFGFWILGCRFEHRGSGFRIKGLGFRVKGSGFSVYNYGLRV